MKKLLLLISILLFISSCGSKDKTFEDTPSGTLEGIKYEETTEITNFVKIATDKGLILVELYPDIAPLTVANFQKLVNEKFYDKTTFYRMITSFMIQGGQFNQGKEAENIKGEFSKNGVTNDLKHERGVISMARANDYNSASSEFFIIHRYSASSKNLNGAYAAFGMTLAGFDTIDAIVKVPTNNEYAINPVVINSIRFITITK